MEISVTLHTKNGDVTTSYPVNHHFSQEDAMKSAMAMMEQYALCGKKFTVTSTLKR